MAVKQQSWFSKICTWRMALFILIYHGFHLGVFIVGWYIQAANKKLAALNTLTFSVWISRGAGLNLSFDCTLILLPMLRNLLKWLRPKIKWLPLDEAQWFHRQVAYSILFFTIVHVSAHYVNFFNIERAQLRPVTAVQIHYTEAGGITGHVMLLCMVLMFTTAHVKIRQQSYEAFWYTHHLFVPFLLALYTHATGCFVRSSKLPYSPFAGKVFWDHCQGYEAFRWELFAAGFYLIERTYREINRRRPARIARVIRHPYDVVEIQMSKPSMKYKPGQWCMINVPAVSRTQWHPFTITSCPFDPYVSVHVRQIGDWTRDLGDALGAGPTQAGEFDSPDPNAMYEIALELGQEMPSIRIDGPYGAPAEDVFDNEIAVLIGTGIGVTPWASILKNIWHLRAGPNPPRRLKRVEFIWICKDTSSFEWFHTLLQSLEAQSQDEAVVTKDDSSAIANMTSPSEFLRIHTYLTQRLDMDTAANIYLNTVGASLDPLTELRSRTNFGRPDFKRLFGAMRDGLKDGSYLGGMDVMPTASPTPGYEGAAASQAPEATTGMGLGIKKKKARRAEIGVYFCGPNTAARDIRTATKEATDRDVRFRFWKEHF